MYCVYCKKLDEFYPKRKLAAALYSETTVELSPSNLGKAFSFAESAEENIHCCPNRIAALASKPMTGMLINENKIIILKNELCAVQNVSMDANLILL